MIMENLKRNRKLISNSVGQIQTAADHCGVDPVVIHLAKHITGSNDRALIYAWVKDNQNYILNWQSKH